MSDGARAPVRPGERGMRYDLAAMGPLLEALDHPERSLEAGHLRIVPDFEAIGMTASGKVQKARLREHAVAMLGL